MVLSADSIKYPELIFGIAGPIGVNIEAISRSLRDELRNVKYESHIIRLTDAMKAFPIDRELDTASDYFHEMTNKIDYGNALCKKHDPAVLARIAIREIRKNREYYIKVPKTSGQAPGLPERVAYIIRQLKRPAEVELLRRVYGKQFVLVSAYGSAESRKSLLREKLKDSLSTLMSESEISNHAEILMERDASEDDTNFGQQLRDTFHLADVFIDGIEKQEMDIKLNRFIQAFFGRTDISPSKAEYGMYAAKSASLRSSDLSRQVGAAIFSDDGELITQGCNEVPKALGGTYWDLETPDFRDVRVGYDPNNSARNQLLRDLFERLMKHGLLSAEAISIGSPANLVKHLSTKPTLDSRTKGVLYDAKVMDLTEFGRILHAEMCAICDAARIGRRLKGETLYCTTFPCHNCAKHIIAAGIKKVVYMEPYPKSLAKELHKNEISVEIEDPSKVSFIPFLGISPFRYRDIFQKGRRKSADGNAKTWLNDSERPMIDIVFPSYDEVEKVCVSGLFATFERADD